jgi:hypothetical protein
MPSLPEIQAAFIKAVLDRDCARIAPWIIDNGIDAAHRVGVYRTTSASISLKL